MKVECNHCEVVTNFVKKADSYVCNTCNFTKIIRINHLNNDYFSIGKFENDSIKTYDSKQINKELHYKYEIRKFIKNIK